MIRAKLLLNLTVLFLLAGTAMGVAAENDTTANESAADEDEYHAAKQQCQDEYDDALADAEADYKEAQSDEADGSATGSNSGGTAAGDDSSNERDAAAQYEEDKAEAKRDYEDCMDDAANDYRASQATSDKDPNAESDRAHRECAQQRDRAYADSKQQYERDMDHLDAEEKGDGASTSNDSTRADGTQSNATDRNYESERDKREQQYHDEKARADARYKECLEKIDDRPNDGSSTDDRLDDLQRHYDGRHVELSLTAYGIEDYTVGDDAIFDSVSLHHEAGWKGTETRGANHVIFGSHAKAGVTDAPTGILRFGATNDARIDVAFADGVEAVYPDEAGYDRPDKADERNDAGEIVRHRIYLKGDDWRGALWVPVGFLVEDRGIVASGEFRFAKMAVDSDRPHRDQVVQDAINDGRLAIEVDVQKERTEAFQYGDVNITFENATGGLVATVEGHGDGKTILFNVDADAYDSLDDLQVLYDGELIGFADSLEDVMDISDGIAEYIIIVGAEATQVLVQIPHFSVHTIQLQGTTVGTSPAVAAVAIAIGGGAAAAFIAVTMVSRRRGD